MIKHKVKYRVVGADRSKRKYSINLDDGASFQLTRELLQGIPAQEGSKPLCSMTVQDGGLIVRAGADQNDIVLNSKPVRESEVRPGDLVQVEEFSIEILECPHTVRNETNATQFLDVSEIFGSAAKAANQPAPVSTPAPASSHSDIPSLSSPAASESIDSSSLQEAPPTTLEEAPAPSAAAFVNPNEFPSLAETQDAPAVTEAPSQDKWSSQQAWENQSNDSQTRVISTPVTSHSTAPTHTAPAPAAAARTRTSSNVNREEAPSYESTTRQQSRTSNVTRDTERHSSYRQSRKPVASQSKKRAQQENSPSSFTESDFSHIAMSAGMGALGVAVTTRVLLSGSTTPQGMTVACAALSSIPVLIGMSIGLSKLNEYMSTEAHLRDYSRFLGWTMLCMVPWAYTQGASFPIAIFTTLLTTVLISVAFVARFRPNMARFSAVGGGLSVVALAALITQHHYVADKTGTQEALSTENSPTETAATQTNAAPANATASGASNASGGSGTSGPTTAGAVTTAPAGNSPAAPNSLQPQGTNLAAQPGNPQTNPAIPSAVNDTIPAIPSHPDTSASAGSVGRVPAAVDPSAKGIIDPLAHEEFFSAIKMGNLEVVKSLIDRKQVDPDFTLDKGSTPLIAAAAAGRIKVVEYLLRRRVNINAQDPHGTTALMWAVFKGHRDVAKYLISKGADTKVIRDDGDTAMDIARKWRQNEIVAILKNANNPEDGVMNKKSRTSKTRKRRR
jgi:hypothetical protein